MLAKNYSAQLFKKWNNICELLIVTSLIEITGFGAEWDSMGEVKKR